MSTDPKGLWLDPYASRFTTKTCRRHNEVMMIFRTSYLTYDPSWKVAITGEGEHLGALGRITTLEAVEVTPGSCQWIAVAMVPSFSVVEFQCVVVDGQGNIVEWEKQGVNRKIAVKDSHVYVTLPWSLPDIYFFQQDPPKNFGMYI